MRMIGDAQPKLRDFAAARAAYDKALASIDVRQAVARGNAPALYALADAQAGMGDLSSAQAAELTDTAQHSQYRARACAYYADSAHTWSNVAELASYSPDQFPSGNPQSVQTRLAACPPLPAVADR
jgi:hypothetical protein